MLMIPATPCGTHSQAEKRFFDRLRVVCTDSQDESLVAYHSINLTRHAYKRFGEIDFLICGFPGIFVLEVKGGRITCQGGVWRYTNRYGAVSESVEGPFKQAESALHGLMANLRANLASSIVSQFTIGYGVVFPDCEWRVKGAEWDPHILADAREFYDLERWLHKLFQYWRNKDGCSRQPDTAALKALRLYLRPEFEVLFHCMYRQVKLKSGLLHSLRTRWRWSIRNTPFRKIMFAEIANFKGLENEAVIVVDLESPVSGDKPLAMHYVAMSRARAVLSLIFCNRTWG